ncbi:OB-fold domain-containing protein [Boseaceae bacterium BT-24-1]|nr:OB-fold domain-containing protein [Boseaceae bacterium BT-24-1]
MSVLREALDHQPETKAFWSELAEGRFKLCYCRACERAHWYPRAICPHCASPETEWRAASGQGTIYSYSIARTAAEPFAIAYVTLAEGPTMMTNIVGSDFAEIAIGKPVEIAFGHEAEDGITLPVFRLA